MVLLSSSLDHASLRGHHDLHLDPASQMSTLTIDIWAMSWENLFMLYAKNKSADQPAHPRILISTFVVPCLDSITSFYIRNLKDSS